MKFDEVLRTFAGYFEAEGIRYALIGGLAMQAWGRSRLTKDIDFAVDASSRDRVVALAESLGYETLYVSEGYSNHAHDDPSWGRVDFMYLYGDTAEKIFAAAQQKTIVGDAEAPVASAEHLAMMKAVAMKNQPHRTLFEGGTTLSIMDCWICTMPSNARVELLTNLEVDVPTTAADNEALWRVRELNRMDPAEYLEFLLAFTEGVPASREITAFDQPFTLEPTRPRS